MVDYPFIPENRDFKFAASDDEFMNQAQKAQQVHAGDPSYPVGAVLVKNGEVIASAGNGYNKGRQMHVCPRLVQECPSGTGYDLCTLHDSPGHAEQMVIQKAKENGLDTEGSDLYMYGHWWACEPCWNAIIEAGVKDVYLLDGADKEFDRDKVYSKFLQPSVKKVFIAGAMTNVDHIEEQYALYEALGDICEEMGCTTCIPHRDNDRADEMNDSEIFQWSVEQVQDADVIVAEVSRPSLGVGGELVLANRLEKPIILLSKKDSDVSCFVNGIPSVVYHAKYKDQDEARKYLANVLKQI